MSVRLHAKAAPPSRRGWTASIMRPFLKRTDSRTIVFLSPYDPANVLAWSGTPMSLYRALQANQLGVKVRPLDGGALNLAAQLLNNLLWHLGFKLDCRLSTPYAIVAGIYLSLWLLVIPGGPIVAVAASNYLPFLITRRRIVYISDATFRAAAKINPAIKELPRWLARQFDRNEARSLGRASSVIYSSKWAADSAEHEYGINPGKIHRLIFGANIPKALIDEHYTPKRLEKGEVRLVLVSADWHRKNGDKAIEICRALIRAGVDARLTIIGQAPSSVRTLSFVDDRGFLTKSNPSELAEICEAYRNAHFLLLPTRADASPIVFAECQAFGVPPVTHDVGGTSSMVTHGQTGLLLPPDAPPERFVAELLPLIRDEPRYTAMSRKCRDWYLTHAQWDAWSRLIFDLSGMTKPAGRDTAGENLKPAA